MSSAILYKFRNTWRIIPIITKHQYRMILSERVKNSLSSVSLLRKVEAFLKQRGKISYIGHEEENLLGLTYIDTPFSDLCFAPFSSLRDVPSFTCKGSLSDAINRCPSCFTYLEIFNEGEWSTLDLRRNQY